MTTKVEKKIEKKNLSSYLAEAKSWESSNVNQLQRSARTAWWVAIASGALATIAVISIAVLGPLKTSVPYVIRVDNATGSVDIVNALTNGKTNYDEVINKYNVQWYVRWRESYSKHLIKDYYQNVGIMSSREVQNSYAQFMSVSNPKSPIVLYSKSSPKINVTIKSTSFIKPNIALVRFYKAQEGRESETISHWAATIAFQYVGTPMNESSRAINPLGMQVIEYRLDPDQEISQNSLPSPLSNVPPDVQAAPISTGVPAISSNSVDR